MLVTLKIWTDARSKVGAERVFRRALQQIEHLPVDPAIETYPKTGGHVCQCGLDIECTVWEYCVVEIIAIGQQLGSAWTIFGDITQEVSCWSTNASIVGVKAIELTVQRPA